ncbi:hypothetical protein [Bacillus sp. C1]
MEYNTELLTSWIESMLQREIAFNKLLEIEVDMVNSLLDVENQMNDILDFQNTVVSSMDCICNSNTMLVNAFESIIYKYHLMRE